MGDRIPDLDLANALDAIYAYATEPLNWEEMARLLIALDAAADEDAREVVEGLRLHVVRAETLARRLHDGQLFAEPVPGLCHVLVGGDQRVLDISTAAATLFEPFCGRLTVGKSLQFLDPENTAQYRAVLSALDASNGPLPPLLRLVRGEDNDGQFVYVVREERLHKSKTETGLPQSRGGGIVLLMPDHAARDPQHVLFGGMGLTPAEMRIAAKLKEGLSAFDPELSFESFAVDFEEFLDAQKIESAYLWARSSSALFGLAAAARLGPRVRRVMLCSACFGVPAREGCKSSMVGYYFGHLARNPWLLEATLSILRAKISRPLLGGHGVSFFERSPPDAELFSRMPHLLQFKVESVIEAMSQGAGGLVREAKLFFDEAEIDLTNLAALVVIWYGELDGIIPVAEMRRGLKSLRFTPEEVRVISGGGHNFTICAFR